MSRNLSTYACRGVARAYIKVSKSPAVRRLDYGRAAKEAGRRKKID